jgi:hypothetical protein
MAVAHIMRPRSLFCSLFTLLTSFPVITALTILAYLGKQRVNKIRGA